MSHIGKDKILVFMLNNNQINTWQCTLLSFILACGVMVTGQFDFDAMEGWTRQPGWPGTCMDKVATS
jgi:hypothetical protein